MLILGVVDLGGFAGYGRFTNLSGVGPVGVDERRGGSVITRARAIGTGAGGGQGTRPGCGRGSRLAALVIGAVLLFLLVAPMALAANSIYWSISSGPIRAGNLDGTGSAASLFTKGGSEPLGVAIDPAAGKIYWADFGAGTIRVANLNGTGSPSTLFTGEITPYGLAIDPAAGKIYWADYNAVGGIGAGTIRVANLNGTGSAANLFAGETEPGGVAIDPAAGKIYWSELSPGTIRVANLNGTGSPSTLFMGEDHAYGIAIDPAAGKIYWAEVSGAIRVANLNGSGSPAPLFTGESSPTGVAIDPAAGKIYWANEGGTIRVGNLNGTGSPADLFTGESNAEYLALLRSPAGTAAPQVSGGSTVGSVLSCSQGTWASDLLGSLLYQAPQSFAYSWSENGTPIAGASGSSITASSPGAYACQVTAQNQAGPTSQASAAHAVLASTTATPPATTLTKAKISSKHHTAKFSFNASAVASGFQCALIKHKKHHKKPKPSFSSCHSPKSYKHLKPGKYTFEVRALSATGPGTPASKNFKIT